MLSFYKRIFDKSIAVQILMVHIHCGDLVIFIGSIIVNSLVSIAAGGVNGNFILALGYLTAASLLFYRSQERD